jgi:hypothetical protein
MKPIVANLAKLRSLLDHGWRIRSYSWNLPEAEAVRTTVVLGLRGEEISLQSDDFEFLRFCTGQRPSFNHAGDPAFRGFADLNRYHQELFNLAYDLEAKRKAAARRVVAGEVHFAFNPEALIAEFLKLRKWGDARFLPLKVQHFEVFAFVAITGKRAADFQRHLQEGYPESVRYANRIDQLLRKAFDPTKEPIKNYLRFADINRIEFATLARRLGDQLAINNDTFSRLAASGNVEGHLGLHYLIDMYRRYMDWGTPLLKLLADAVCLAEGRELPEIGLGITKRTELIRQSSYAEIVDCVDPRIRHAASHDAITFDKDRGVVQFCGVDGDGNRKFDDFELSYAQATDITSAFIRGFVPGSFTAFGLHQLLQLMMTVGSGDYMRLLLLIDNEATEA